MTRIAAIGDSIVYGRMDFEAGGWVTRLRAALDEQDQGNSVFNLGIEGDTTKGVVKRLERECLARYVDTVIVGVGTNDARHDADPATPHLVSPYDFKTNLVEIIETIRRLHMRPILMGMLPINESALTREDDIYVFLEDQEIYEKIARKVATANNVNYIDLWGDWMADDNYKLWLADGVHPNALGHQILFERVLDLVKPEPSDVVEPSSNDTAPDTADVIPIPAFAPDNEDGLPEDGNLWDDDDQLGAEVQPS